MKKCPVCNSTKIKKTENSMACDRCGYINKDIKIKKNNKEYENN